MNACGYLMRNLVSEDMTSKYVAFECRFWPLLSNFSSSPSSVLMVLLPCALFLLFYLLPQDLIHDPNYFEGQMFPFIMYTISSLFVSTFG